MQANAAYNTPVYGQQGASYRDTGTVGRDDYTAQPPFPSTSQARSEGDLPQSTAPTNGGSAYQSLNYAYQKENTTVDDTYQISPNVQVEFDEVFKEPSCHSRHFSIAWLNRLIFTYTQIAVYVFFSILLGILLSFLWGIFLAGLNFLSVYILQPSANFTFILVRAFAMIYRAIVRSVLDPICESYGLVFSQIRGNFSLNASGFLPIAAQKEGGSIQEIKHY